MIEELISDGLQLLQNGHPEAAVERFNAVLESSRLPEVLYYRGVARDMMGRPEEALQDLSMCLELDPESSQALCSRSMVHRGQKNWAAALADLEAAYLLDPDDYRCATSYAQMLLSIPDEASRDPERAEEVALEACKVTDFQEPTCLETFAEALAQNGRRDQADEVRSMLARADVQEIHFPTLSQEVYGYFGSVMGQDPEPKSLQELAPILPQGVSVGTVRAPDGCDFNLLFSVGMSQQSLPVPDGLTASKYGYCELCLRLPRDWPLEPDLEDRVRSWPWVWLRIVAIQAHLEGVWLNGGPTLFPPPDKLEPLWPDSEYAGFLLLPNVDGFQGFPSGFGMYVHTITAVPVTLSEYRLVANQGLQALLRRFQENQVSLCFNPDRTGVA